MILLISAQQPQLFGPIDDRFGRCPWIIRFDTDLVQWKAFENPGAGQAGGAGVSAAQFVIDQQANVVISGDFGPHAVSAFRAANIEMRLFTKDISSVQQAVDYFVQNKLPVYA